MVKQKKNYLVKKGTDLVNANAALSPNSAKVFAAVLGKIHTNDKELKTYEINVFDIIGNLANSNNNIDKNMKLIGSELRKIELKGVIDTETGLQVDCGLVSYSLYDPNNGKMIFVLPDPLKPYLLSLKHRFLSYDIQNILELKTSYAIALYEKLKHDVNIRGGYGNIQFDLEEIINMLRIPLGYKKPYDIKRHVIDKAIIEVNKKTDIKATCSSIKNGRFVTGFSFEVHVRGK